MNLWSALALAPYLLLLVLMLAYSAHSLLLVLVHARAPQRPPPTPLTELPHVAVQLPVFNEENVVPRLLDAVAALDWPADRLTIQLLDDSTDATPALAAPAIARMQAAGLRVQHLRRTDRHGFKAGALAHGLTQTDAAFLAIFDADFVPPREFLRRAMGHFADPHVAAVQGRWTHLNRGWSRLTRAQALAIDGHFAIEQEARCAAGWFLNFNGSAGVWRRTAITAAGGWSADTLTEDLDLSYRAQLAGWRLVLDRDLTCPAELPTTLAAFKAQQRRWATGSMQTARKLLPAIWRSPTTVPARVAATLHLTHYAVHPLSAATAVLAVPCVLLPGLVAPPGPLWAVLLPFGLTVLGPTTLYLYARRVLGLPVLAGVRDLGLLTLVGIGLTVSNTRAVLRAFQPGTLAFERTPKLGLVRAGDAVRRRYGVPADGLRVVEIGLACYCLTAAVGLVWTGVYAVAPFLLLDAAGLGLAALGSRPHREETP